MDFSSTMLIFVSKSKILGITIVKCKYRSNPNSCSSSKSIMVAINDFHRLRYLPNSCSSSLSIVAAINDFSSF